MRQVLDQEGGATKLEKLRQVALVCQQSGPSISESACHLDSDFLEQRGL